MRCIFMHDRIWASLWTNILLSSVWVRFAECLLQVRQMFQSLSESDREMQVQMGLDTLGDGTHYVARSIAGFNPGNQSVQVSLLYANNSTC